MCQTKDNLLIIIWSRVRCNSYLNNLSLSLWVVCHCTRMLTNTIWIVLFVSPSKTAFWEMLCLLNLGTGRQWDQWNHQKISDVHVQLWQCFPVFVFAVFSARVDVCSRIIESVSQLMIREIACHLHEISLFTVSFYRNGSLVPFDGRSGKVCVRPELWNDFPSLAAKNTPYQAFDHAFESVDSSVNIPCFHSADI